MCIQKATDFERLPILFCYPWSDASSLKCPKKTCWWEFGNDITTGCICCPLLASLPWVGCCWLRLSWLADWAWVMENLNLHSSTALQKFRSFGCHFWTIHLQCCCSCIGVVSLTITNLYVLSRLEHISSNGFPRKNSKYGNPMTYLFPLQWGF